MWGTLSEFWNSITDSVASTTENLISYPVSFFENIGNAVGGTLGSLFDNFLHTFNDLIIFTQYYISQMGQIFSNLSIPIQYVFYFFKNIFEYALGTPDTPEITYTWTAGVLSIFDHVPYWEVLGTIIGVGLTILAGAGMFKMLLKI